MQETETMEKPATAVLDTKAALLAAVRTDRPAHRRTVKEWGGEVFIRAMSGDERDEVETWRIENPRLIGLRAFVVSKGLCNGEGDSLDLDPLEAAELGSRNGAALDYLFWEIMRLSAYTDDEIKALAKNSHGGQNGSSGLS